MNSSIRIEMFGTLRLITGAEVTTHFRTKKTAALLAVLAMHPGRISPREELSDLLWPDESQESGRNRLRICLSSLRRIIEPPGTVYGTILVANRSSVFLNPEAFSTDVEDFTRALHSTTNRLERLCEAVALYRGELLPGHQDEWVYAERDRLADLYLRALQQLATLFLENKDIERSLDCIHRGIQVDPYAEESYRIAMKVHVENGRPSAAQNVFELLSSVLHRDLGSEPSRETKDLASSLRVALPNKPRPAMQAPPQSQFVPPSESPTPRRWPAQYTRFFGREAELARLIELLSPVNNLKERLVTLIGPGGVGKTRLALEIAAALDSVFTGRIWFVPLADSRDKASASASIATAIVKESTGPDPWPQVEAALRGAPALIVLDNLEQIADQILPDIERLRQASSEVFVLATSRRSLGASGEQVFSVLPLPVPDRDSDSPAILAKLPSIQLFLDRARAVRPDFAITPKSASQLAALCRLLEGLPLAVELAAARVRVLSATEMLMQAERRFELLVSKRGDRVVRHRSLWASLEWSYDLLGPEHQNTFVRLSAFRGGWTLDAARAVCPERDLIDTLDTLLADSLIQLDESGEETRYRILEAVRDFAWEHLPEEDRITVRQRHAGYYVSLANEANKAMDSGDQGVWLDRIEADLPNIRAACSWLQSSEDDPEVLLEFVADLSSFWDRRGSLTEGRRLLKSAIEHSHSDSPNLVRALLAACRLAITQCDMAEARRYVQKGVELCRSIADRAGEAMFLCEFGVISRREGDLGGAMRYWQDSLELNEAAGAEEGAARVLMNLAILARDRKEFAEARSLYDRALPVFERLKDPRKSAIVLQNLGLLACEEGDFEGASRHFQRALATRGRIGDYKGMAFALGALGQTALTAGRDEKAWPYYKECLEICARLENRTGLEYCIWDLAVTWPKHGIFDLAARLLGMLDTMYREKGISLQPEEQRQRDEAVSCLRSAMGEAALRRAMAEGSSSSLDTAAVLVREKLFELCNQ